MKLKIPDAILSIDPYVPGKPMAALERELGIVDSIKLASNENPIGSSPLALDALQDALKSSIATPMAAAMIWFTSYLRNSACPLKRS